MFLSIGELIPNRGQSIRRKLLGLCAYPKDWGMSSPIDGSRLKTFFASLCSAKWAIYFFYGGMSPPISGISLNIYAMSLVSATSATSLAFYFFMKSLPLEIWLIIHEYCKDEKWSEYNLAVALGIQHLFSNK